MIDTPQAAEGCGHPNQPAGEVLKPKGDEFNGDNARLIECINALLDLDAAGALVPHGVGGHARKLLSAAASRLRPLPQGERAVAFPSYNGIVIEAARRWPATNKGNTYRDAFMAGVEWVRPLFTRPASDTGWQLAAPTDGRPAGYDEDAMFWFWVPDGLTGSDGFTHLGCWSDRPYNRPFHFKHASLPAPPTQEDGR